METEFGDLFEGSNSNNNNNTTSNNNNDAKDDEVLEEAKASSSSDQPTPQDNSDFECNICFDLPTDPVVTLCGHLYCWPCIHQWLEIHTQQSVCPVCKAAVDREKVVPIYGRGNPNQKDPRTKTVPPRPQGQRTEAAPPGNNFFGSEFSSGINFSAGFGLFPGMGLYYSTGGGQGGTIRGGRYGGGAAGIAQEQMAPNEMQQALFSRILLIFGLVILTSLLMS